MSTPPVSPGLPVLVGESNPYNPDPAFALYPHPRGAAGDRLRRVLGLTDAAYMRRFRRVNLLPAGRWRAGDARRAADRMLPAAALHPLPAHYRPPALVLLGRRVQAAFGFRGAPMVARVPAAPPLPVAYLVPHPSGRSRAWNDPRTARRVRRLLRPLLALPDPDPLAAAVEAAEARVARHLARDLYRARRGPGGRTLRGLASALGSR